MVYTYGFLFTVLLSSLTIALVNAKMKGIVTLTGVMTLSAISSILSFGALTGSDTLISMQGSLITGEIPVVIDPLSAWFMLVINFTFITGALYGIKYMQAYQNKKTNLSLHWICYIFTHACLLSVCAIQNSIAFLVAWEIMALSTFCLVIFEGYKTKTLRAGMNYLIQSHIAILILTIAFVWISVSTKSFGFQAISDFASTAKPYYSFILMLLFFTGFGFKAGFVPFHTWLPYAHPAAPSHVSGMMSGVLIKIGIYGILRMIFLMNTNYLATGYFILIISVITGIYGVMLAIVQHNLKKLLAYHSIENIGIIGMGIGLGCIGIGLANPFLAVLGFSGALLHTLNHSLFKSLLFYSAGNVYQSTHTMNIEQNGGLIKRLPFTAFFFLIAALAICGLPPFNGFVSEFIIYSGLLKGSYIISFPYIIVPIFGMFGLVLIGGLAIMCFTKAFGSVFLGSPRNQVSHNPEGKKWFHLLPMFLIVLLIIAIGIFPQGFTSLLSLPVQQLTGNIKGTMANSMAGHFEIVNQIGLYSLAFIILCALIYFIRHLMIHRHRIETGPTWGCGYVAPNNKMQYTASSFVRSYRKIAEPLLLFQKNKKEVRGIFPGEAGHQIHSLDKIEEYLILWPLKQFRYFLGQFSFLQNGKLQFYILYGLLFISLLAGIPFIGYLIRLLTHFLNS